MANKYESTIRDLKATFFDIFYEHTDEMAGMIEILAKDESNDVVKMESAIFQRIILLNKAASNVKTLMKNVEALNYVRGNGAVQVVSEGTKALVGEVVNASMKDMSNNPSAVIPQQKIQNVAPPVQVPVQAPVAVTSTPVAVPVNNVPVNNASVNVAATVENSTPVKPPVAPTPVVPLVSKSENMPPLDVVTAPITASENKTVAQTLMEKAAGTAPEINNTSPEEQKNEDAPKNKFKLIKTSDSKVKAILVSDKQYEKLRASHDGQFKLLDFGSMTVAPANPKTKIEDLMKKASTLYKEGKVSEAQALYAEISALNKKAQSDGKPNVLIKKAA